MLVKRKWAHSLAVAAMLFTLVPGVAQAQSQQDLQIQINALKLQLDTLQTQLEASEQTKASSDGMKVKWEPAPSIKSADGNFEMNMRGRIYADAAWISDDDDTMDVKATEFRTARLGIEGKAGKTIKYKFEADFAENEVNLKDAYLQVKTNMGPSVTVGQFKTPNSLDEQTSSRHTSVMERASFTDAFDLARQMGVAVSFGGDNWTAKLGAFRGSNSIDAEDEGSAFAGRVTYSPKVEETQLHFGGSFRSRETGDQSNLKYSQRPHQHLSTTKFVSSGSVGDKDMFYGVEFGVLHGPLWAAAEFAQLKADDDAGDPTFSGGYAEVGYFLTGESRGYKASKGTWNRPKVSNSLSDGGMGAWAIAARYDTIDLTDGTYFGGQQDTYIVGLNWYLNRYTRMMANYSHSKVEDAWDVVANGLDGKNEIDGFGLRAQIDW